MEDNEIKFLLVRYISNQANESEVSEVKRWIKLHPENELYFIELYEAWQNMLYLKPQLIDADKAYRTLFAKIQPGRKPAPRLRLLKIAAVFILAVIATVFIIDYSHPAKTDFRIVAEKGMVRKVILSDGTAVWLNAVSTIRFDKNFNKTNRTVFLEGEAFFDIAHGIKKIPFLVKTKNYTVRDIGTKFNLKAYSTDQFFEATVLKGEVSVEGNSDNHQQDFSRIYVKPLQALKIYYQADKTEKSKEILSADHSIINEVRVTEVDSAKMDVYDGWKSDLLVFDGSTLADIAKVLERRYNVTINLDSSELKDIRYSGSFRSVPDIDKVLLIIKQNTPINYTIKDQNVTITKSK